MKIYKIKKSFKDKVTGNQVEYWKIYLVNSQGLKVYIKGNDPTANELLVSLAIEVKE